MVEQDVLLSIQRALVGSIGPSLVGVSMDWNERHVQLSWYVAPGLAEEERDDLYAAGGMVAGDLLDDVEFAENFVEVSGSAAPTPRGTWVFLRRELR